MENAPLIEQAKAALIECWPSYVTLEVSQVLIELAGE